MTIVWEEPPPKFVRVVWRERLAPLMGRPGEWARIVDRRTEANARSIVRDLRRGKSAQFINPEEWEFRAARIPDAPITEDLPYAVWARYLDTKEQAA